MDMKPQKYSSIIKSLPFAIIILFTIYYLAYNKETAIQTIIDYTPETPWLAVLVLLFLYSVKSLLATLFGSSISEPSSPMFWISILLMTLFAGGSLLAYYIYKRKIKKYNT